jgi:hypothetical protein
MSKSTMLFNSIEREHSLAHKAGLSTNTGKMAMAACKRYKRILVERIHEDMELPLHVQSQYGHPLTMRCAQCEGSDTPVFSVADVGDFADKHAHSLAWGCGCMEFNFDHEDTCRWCGAARDGREADSKIAVHRMVRRYAVKLAGQSVAWVEAPSLLRARRAARGMYPGKSAGELTVSWMGVGEWTARYGQAVARGHKG